MDEVTMMAATLEINFMQGDDLVCCFVAFDKTQSWQSKEQNLLKSINLLFNNCTVIPEE